MSEGDDEALQINRLHRFAKHSPRLVLHEYSHCEVPAGCGGVVIRWIDPEQGRPARIEVRGHNTRATAWLDGVPLESAVCLLREGTRVVAVALERTAPGELPFTISARPDRRFEVELVTASAHRFCGTTTAPADPRWMMPETYDGDWAPLVDASAGALASLEPWRRRAFDSARERGQRVFGLLADRLWIRVAFVAGAFDAMERP